MHNNRRLPFGTMGVCNSTVNITGTITNLLIGNYVCIAMLPVNTCRLLRCVRSTYIGFKSTLLSNSNTFYSTLLLTMPITNWIIPRCRHVHTSNRNQHRYTCICTRMIPISRSLVSTKECNIPEFLFIKMTWQFPSCVRISKSSQYYKTK